MNRKARMIKTSIIYFIGNFASKLLAFFLLPLYTMYLTPEDYGRVDVFISTLPLIAPIFTMQVTESVFRFLCDNNASMNQKRTINNSIIIFLAGMFSFTILYTPFVIKFKLEYGVLFLTYFITSYIAIFLQQILRGLSKNIEYAITGIIMTGVQATLNILLITKLEIGGESLLISAIGASTIISIYIAIKIKIWNFIDFRTIDIGEIKKQLKYGVPLIPNQICWWMIGLLGRYILLYFSGTSDNGILAVSTKFPTLLTTINSIFLLAWTENIIKEFNSKDRDEYFCNSFSVFCKYSIVATCCLLPIIKIYNMSTIPNNFGEPWLYIPILYIGALFNGFSSFLGTIYTASMKTKDAFTTTVIAAISNLILSLILVPYLNIWGVVIANMISFVVLFISRLISIKSIIAVNIKINDIIPSILNLFVTVIAYYKLGNIGQILFLCINIFIIVVSNKVLILEYLKKIILKLNINKNLD